ncbi:class I SAM-dependent methyltransferase [Lysinibacillus sp. FSL K6-0057]|uniref:class I SAM-dependent methyltransferase n=1 Tax=Lysinibacillus sp. FSL K6-0057 TaxID=2921411 RepID=UPI00315A1D1F
MIQNLQGGNMDFSIEWENIYKKNQHLSIWPWSDLVSYVSRYVNSKSSRLKVLELGCGAGANIPYFLSLKSEYTSVEGSESIVNLLHEKFPQYQESIHVGDFTNFEFKKNYYDLVIDRGSLTCNTTSAIQRCLNNVYEAMKPGSQFIGIDWFSTKHSDFDKGSVVEDDIFTKMNIESGHLSNLGKIHFSDKQHLLDLFSKFDIQVLEHKTTKNELSNSYTIASWNLVAKKM